MSEGQLRDYIAALEEENEILREKVRLMEEERLGGFSAPPALGLTGQEIKLFALLLSRDLITKEYAISALYSDRPNDMPQEKIIDVFVCKMRRKLKPFGISIITQWGQGYYITAPDKAKAKEMIAALTTPPVDEPTVT